MPIAWQTHSCSTASRNKVPGAFGISKIDEKNQEGITWLLCQFTLERKIPHAKKTNINMFLQKKKKKKKKPVFALVFYMIIKSFHSKQLIPVNSESSFACSGYFANKQTNHFCGYILLCSSPLISKVGLFDFRLYEHTSIPH